MKRFIKRFLTVSILVINNLLLSVSAGNLNSAEISIMESNNLSDMNISGDVVNSFIISDEFMEQNEIEKSDIKAYDSIIIPYDTKNKVSTETEKVVYDTVEWTESVKANIKIGEACIDGDKGKNVFDTATYIQTDTKSSMFPADAVSYLMSNLSIGEVKTEMGRTGNSVIIDYNGKKIEFTVGSDKVLIDNYAKDIDNGAICELNDGKIFIPLRSFSGAIDCKIDWVADGKIVNLEKTFNRKSKVKRIETIEPSTEATTKSTIPTVSKGNKCSCPSYCSCSSSTMVDIVERKRNIIDIEDIKINICRNPNLCIHCAKCDVCSKKSYCNCNTIKIHYPSIINFD